MGLAFAWGRRVMCQTNAVQWSLRDAICNRGLHWCDDVHFRAVVGLNLQQRGFYWGFCIVINPAQRLQQTHGWLYAHFHCSLCLHLMYIWCYSVELWIYIENRNDHDYMIIYIICFWYQACFSQKRNIWKSILKTIIFLFTTICICISLYILFGLFLTHY